MTKVFTNPVLNEWFSEIRKDIIFIDVQQKIQARRKMARTLTSRATVDNLINIEDIFEVYLQTGMMKRGKWSAPRIVHMVDNDSHTVTIPGKWWKRLNVSTEDIRLDLPEDYFAFTVLSAINAIAKWIEHQASVKSTPIEKSNLCQSEYVNSIVPVIAEDADFSGNNANMN